MRGYRAQILHIEIELTRQRQIEQISPVSARLLFETIGLHGKRKLRRPAPGKLIRNGNDIISAHVFWHVCDEGVGAHGHGFSNGLVSTGKDCMRIGRERIIDEPAILVNGVAMDGRWLDIGCGCGDTRSKQAK